MLSDKLLYGTLFCFEVSGSTFKLGGKRNNHKTGRRVMFVVAQLVPLSID